MTDIVFNSVTEAALIAEAKRLGFTDEEGNILSAGALISGGGWTLNIVGEIYTANNTASAGYWGRLRVNGNLNDLPVFDAKIIQYVWDNKLNGWTSDGASLAPDWVDSVGFIA